MKSSHEPSKSGTIISHESYQLSQNSDAPKSITTKGHIAMVEVTGGMTSTGRLFRRVFQVIDDLDAHVFMVTQASSDFSISLAVPQSEAHNIKEALEIEFFNEMEFNESFRVQLLNDLCMICTVGETLKSRIGFFSTFSNSIASAGASIRAACQGPSERLLACVIDDKFKDDVTRQLHKDLFPDLERKSPTQIGQTPLLCSES